jgi:Phosphodiester glycosidase
VVATLSFLILSLVSSTRSVADSSTAFVTALKPVVPKSPSIGASHTAQPPLKYWSSGQGPSASLAEGNAPILLNGQAYPLRWVQTQTPQGLRTLIADGSFRQLTGARFLSSDRAEVQPIEWFGMTANLPTQLLLNDRYLDITDWAKTVGWQMQIPADPTNLASTNPLSITAPTAQVSQITQGSSPEVDRIVINLDRPATFQVEAQSKEWVLSLDATLSPDVLQQFKPTQSRRISSLKLEPSTKGFTTLRLGIPISSRPVITTQANQLTIDVGIPDMQPQSILWQPGIQWRQQVMPIGNNPLTVMWCELDPRLVNLRPIIPNATPDLAGIATLLNTAQKSRSLVAMNGGFFNRTNQLPLGMIQTDGVLRSGPILNRGVMAWDDAGNFRFDRYTLQETVTIAAQTIALNHLNSAYVQAGVSRYTRGWGSLYKTMSDSEVVMTVIGDRITDQKSMAAAGAETVEIPAGGYLLVIRSNRTLAATISTGSTVQLRATESSAGISAFPQVLGGGPLLIQHGQIVLNAEGEKFSPAFAKERAARSAVGRSATGKLLMVSVQNSIGTLGASLGDMAQIMQQLGATEALNFDGGSSTTLYLGGEGGQILDRAPRSSARVHNAIGVFLK